jgi:hypothetical protein
VRFVAEWSCRIYLNTIPLADIPRFGQMIGGEGEGMMLEMEAMATELYVEPAQPSSAATKRKCAHPATDGIFQLNLSRN